MEISEETDDDQGSGWFQVKKRHRKFAVQSWVGGFTAKRSCDQLRDAAPVSEKSTSSHEQHTRDVRKFGGNFAAYEQGTLPNSSAVFSEDKKQICGPADSLANEDSQCSKTCSLSVNNGNHEYIDNPENRLKNKPKVVHKFKWGALEDDDLALPRQMSGGTEIRFGNIGDDNLSVCGKHENILSSCQSSSSSDLLQTRSVGTEVDTDIMPNALTYKDQIVEETCSLVNKNLTVVGSDNNIGADTNDAVLNCTDLQVGLNYDVELPQQSSDGIAMWNINNSSGFIEQKINVNSAPVETEADVSIESSVVTSKDVLLEETSKKVNDKNSHIVKLDSYSEVGFPTLNEKLNERGYDESVSKDIQNVQLNFINNTSDSGNLSIQGTGLALKLEKPLGASHANEPRIPEVYLALGLSNAEVKIQDSEALPPENSGCEVREFDVTESIRDSTDREHRAVGDLSKSRITCAIEYAKIVEKSRSEVSGGFTAVASIQDPEVSQDRKIHEKLSKYQHSSVLGDSEAAESKERFRQRLWCFLFENLNRAIDELYLLCELECDIEQMKEAVLVLGEAASDFTELTARVKDFEDVKKSVFQSIDETPISFKTDNRRPHALSWEVRRMTTSPHRAEILASSLEAFRKIQQERARMQTHYNVKILGLEDPTNHQTSGGNLKNSVIPTSVECTKDQRTVSLAEAQGSDINQRNFNAEKHLVESGQSRVNFMQDGYDLPESSSTLGANSAGPPPKISSGASAVGKNRREHYGSGANKVYLKKDRTGESVSLKSMDYFKKLGPVSEREKEKKNATTWKSMDAWKEKRNWEDILSSSCRISSRVSHSPGMSRKSAERARVLHAKLLSPEKKKKTAVDMKREAEDRHARAIRIRNALENERVQKLQRTSEKLNRVSEWQAVRSTKLREGMYARHQRSESRHEAYLAQVAKRAGDESSKVNEVRFITSLNEGNKKLILRQKLHDSELRRAEKLQVMKIKQKEDMAREEAVLERRKLLEAEKLQRLVETQRKKEEAQARREEERKASSAAREARTIEQLRRKEERVKAQQEEAELLAQKLAEKLYESEQRRNFYLEQIRERASMDFRDQSSLLLRRFINKEGQGRHVLTNSGDDHQTNSVTGLKRTTLAIGDVALQHPLKRRVKKIRQKLMAMKNDFSEPPVGFENASIGFRTTMGTARAKINRWIQELKKLRQARKEGAASIGLIVTEMIKFVEGKEPELQASRQAGLIDFLASTLPASHTSKPEACQVTINLLKLLRVVLSASTNRSYFLAQNLLPPIIPLLSTALENYIKMAASLNVSGTGNLSSSKTSIENFESISEVLDGFLWTVTTIIGHINSDDRELQMRDGLLELLIAYQVVHRLRDLFALYDRPQVEGSPFPPTILLGIHLLVVLASRSETSAPIDWGCLANETMAESKIREAEFSEPADLEFSVNNYLEKSHKPASSLMNNSTAVGSSDITLRDGTPEKIDTNEAISTNRECQKKLIYDLVGSNQACMDDPKVSSESPQIPVQKMDENNLIETGPEPLFNSISSSRGPVSVFLSAISETGLVSLPSLLTCVLLQANNRLASEQASYVLPSNFEEVATGVLKVLNNLALLDITFVQKMLARSDLKMEFFHLISFLLSHCTSKWKAATDQVGLLLLEALSLLGHFALFHPGNQAVLRWGKSPTILHKICDLPFVFFSDPELMPILASTLVAACYGCEQNNGVVLQEISLDMLLSLLRSCRNVNQTLDDSPLENSSEANQQNSETKKSQFEVSVKYSRHSSRSTKASLSKAVASYRAGKHKNQRDNKLSRSFEDILVKNNLSSLDASVMLHCRFPSSFIDRAEQFFSTSISNVS